MYYTGGLYYTGNRGYYLFYIFTFQARRESVTTYSYNYSGVHHNNKNPV